MQARIKKLRRIQELFVEGRILVLAAGNEQIPLWVAKPGSFERDEAMQDGRAARAKRVLGFDGDHAEQAIVDAKLTETPKADVIQAVVTSRSNDHYIRALDDVRARKDWQEKLQALDRGEALLADMPAAEDDDERSRRAEELELLRGINLEFLTEVDKVMKGFDAEVVAEFEAMDQDELHAEYRKTWREMAGTQAFLAERRKTELYFAVRECNGTPDETKQDGWDHAKCDSHRQRLAEHRHEVNEFPDALLIDARTVLEDLEMTPADAAFSDAPTSSSASSEQPSEAADSKPSTPTETSPEPAGT